MSDRKEDVLSGKNLCRVFGEPPGGIPRSLALPGDFHPDHVRKVLTPIVGELDANIYARQVEAIRSGASRDFTSEGWARIEREVIAGFTARHGLDGSTSN